jgi:hypothetical protein
MAVQAQANGSRGDELDAGDVFIDANLMAGETAHGHGGVDGLALGLFRMALGTFGSINVLVQWNRVNCGASA